MNVRITTETTHQITVFGRLLKNKIETNVLERGLILMGSVNLFGSGQKKQTNQRPQFTAGCEKGGQDKKFYMVEHENLKEAEFPIWSADKEY